MAWGMFLFIPTPLRLWREDARGHMLSVLPLVGAIVGGIWAIISWLAFGLPRPLFSGIMVVLPWILTGGIHLDGFMDVCDAVGSRGTLDKRMKILKDPSCGAFAVMGMVVLAVMEFSLFMSVGRLGFITVFSIPVVSRASAAIVMLRTRPMEGSQYASLPKHSAGLLVLPIVTIGICIVLPVFFGGFSLIHLINVLSVFAVYSLFALGLSRSFKGINGDISGFSLVASEAAGVALLCILGL